MFFNEEWFFHGVQAAVQHLAQQKERRTTGAVREEHGVKGKTHPFNLMSPQEWQQVTGRDQPTTYINPGQSKVRAQLVDFDAFALVDTLDEIRTLTDPRSAVTQALIFGRERTMDLRLLGPAGLSPTAVAGTAVGGILGLKTTVDEAAESTGLAALPAAQQILHADTGLTMAKILDTKEKFDTANVDPDDRYFFYSPRAMRKLLTDPQVTSSDYNTVNALNRGGFGKDETWVGFKWRLSTQLPVSVIAGPKTIRSCIAVQKMAAGLAVGLLENLEVDKAVHMRNNWQVGGKLSAGAVRIDDLGVVQVDIREDV
jgi:hypothetical protein